MSAKTYGLSDHLKKWGLKVESSPGWEAKGRPYGFYPRAVFCHHTASGSQSGNFASNSIVTYGRSDLPGPLCQFLLGRDATVRLVAGGYANHAGYGGPRASIPENQGNSFAYGIEAENNGVGEPWSKAQLNAYYRLCAALLDWMDIDDVERVFGHKEWTSRKIDPAGIDMNNFRAQVKKALEDGNSLVKMSVARTRPGKRNIDVWRLKYYLKKLGYFKGNLYKKGNKNKLYDLKLTRAVARFQKAELGYKFGNGIAGKSVIEALGFKAV